MLRRVWPPCCDVLRHVGYCLLNFENGQIWANNTRQVATCRNKLAKRTQHVAPNNVATCCVAMLRSFGRGFKTGKIWANNTCRNMSQQGGKTHATYCAQQCCDRLAGALGVLPTSRVAYCAGKPTEWVVYYSNIFCWTPNLFIIISLHNNYVFKSG